MTAPLQVAHPWFHAQEAGDGITRLWEPHIDDLLVSNVWHVRGRDRDLVVDTANGVAALRPAVEALCEGRPIVAVATHGHFDHVGGLWEFDDRRAHEADAADVESPWPLRLRREHFTPGTLELFAYYEVPVSDVLIRALPEPGFDIDAWTPPGSTPTAILSEGDVIDLGDRTIEVLHTPGHTPGSICLWDAAHGTLFTGDALYVDARLSFEDPPAAERSLARIQYLPVQTVHAGHERSFHGDDMRAAIDEALGGIAAGTFGHADLV